MKLGSDEVIERPDQLLRGRIEVSLGPVAAHPAQALDRIGQEDFVGNEQILWRKVAFIHLHSRLQRNVDDLRPHDACGGTSIQPGGVQHSVRDEKQV